MRIGNTEETWAINKPTYKEDFDHWPTSSHGLGPTTNGETFSKGCTTTGGKAWDSLMITDAPFSQIYWYVKAPGDTTAHGSQEEIVNGDGGERKSVFTHPFPKQDGLLGTGSFYEITAYVYRWDQSVYWESYKVFVEDARGARSE